MNITRLKLTEIKTDGGTQARAEINDEAVADYSAAYRNNEPLPPITVFFDSASFWLGDGFHRWHGRRLGGFDDIEADVRQGTRRDAILFSVGANASHGLRRTNADKRKAVETLLADKEWSAWSDREIARACGVSHDMVSTHRRSLSDSDSSGSQASQQRSYTTGAGTTATMNVANIGKTKPEKPTKQERSTPVNRKADQPPADDGPSADELMRDMQRDTERAEARASELEKALGSDDKGSKLVDAIKARDHAVREKDAMAERAKSIEKQMEFFARQLRRCGKAIGVDDPDKIAPAIEAFVRAHKAPTKKAA